MDIVPITIEHADAYMSILKRTTAEERYLRFFAVSNYFTLASTAAYVTPAPGMTGLIAFQGTTPLGVAHAFVDEDKIAEMSVLVAHDSRRQGVGRALITHLLALFGEHRIVANVLTQNTPMRNLAREMGFRIVGSPASIITMVKDAPH